MTPRARQLLLAALLLAAPPLAGCRAQRTLVISSEPPGAEVRLDDEIVGETPLTKPFVHYGTRRLTLRKDGYLTWSSRVEVEAPWYGRFPWDLFSEVIFPIGWKDRHEYHVELEPGVEQISLPDLRTVLDRADALRRAGPDGPKDLPPRRQRPLVQPDLGEEVELPPPDPGGVP